MVNCAAATPCDRRALYARGLTLATINTQQALVSELRQCFAISSFVAVEARCLQSTGCTRRGSPRAPITTNTLCCPESTGHIRDSDKHQTAGSLLFRKTNLDYYCPQRERAVRRRPRVSIAPRGCAPDVRYHGGVTRYRERDQPTFKATTRRACPDRRSPCRPRRSCRCARSAGRPNCHRRPTTVHRSRARRRRRGAAPRL
jgi:hypothetical protein